MRTARRTGHTSLIRDVSALAAAVAVVGCSYGAIAVAAGLPAWAVVAMSLLVFAGGSQFMAVGMLAAGSPVAAVFSGLLLNARHLPFGLALADVVGRRWSARLVGSHLLVDESVAFALAQSNAARRRTAYWLTGATLFVTWQVATVVGVRIAGLAADPSAFGLDAAFPAGLLALLLPSLRDPAARRVALVGATVAVATTPLLPAGLPVLLALAGLPVARLRRQPADVGEPERQP